MSVTVNDKVLDSIVANFQMYTNQSQPVTAFAEFENELKEKMESKGLTNLDNSNESKEIADWIQSEMPKYGGSVQEEYPVEAIVQWDDKAFAQVEKEEAEETKSEETKPEENKNEETKETKPEDTKTEENKPEENKNEDTKETKPEETENNSKENDDDIWETPPKSSGYGVLGRVFGLTPTPTSASNDAEIDVDKTDKKDLPDEVELTNKGEDIDVARAEQKFIDEMNKVEKTSEWKGGDTPGGGTRENVTDLKVWIRDKETGKPIEGSPKHFNKDNLDLGSLKSLLNGNENVEIYGAEIFWNDGAKVWATSANTSKEDFSRFLEYGNQGVKWMDYSRQLTVTDKEKETDPDMKPAEQYDNQEVKSFSNVIDLGGDRYAWTAEDGQRYWANLSDIKDETKFQRLKFAIALKDGNGDPLTPKDEKGNPLAIEMVNGRKWKSDYFDTSGDKAINYESLQLYTAEVDGEKREYYVVSGFENPETGTRSYQSYAIEKNAKDDPFYDSQHLFEGLLRIKPENYDKMSDEEKKDTSFYQLTQLAKDGDDKLLYRTIGDNDAKYGSMHKDAFKGETNIELLHGNFDDGDAIWKVKTKGNTFIVSQELMPNNIDGMKITVNGEEIEVGGDHMSKEDSWKKLTQYLSEKDDIYEDMGHHVSVLTSNEPLMNIIVKDGKVSDEMLNKIGDAKMDSDIWGDVPEDKRQGIQDSVRILLNSKRFKIKDDHQKAIGAAFEEKFGSFKDIDLEEFKKAAK